MIFFAKYPSYPFPNITSFYYFLIFPKYFFIFPEMFFPFYFLFILFSPVWSIEFKLKSPKPDEHRCAYEEKQEGKDGKSSASKWLPTPSATACQDDLPVWPADESSEKNLCEQIFVRKDGELRPKACDNECSGWEIIFLIILEFFPIFL